MATRIGDTPRPVVLPLDPAREAAVARATARIVTARRAAVTAQVQAAADQRAAETRAQADAAEAEYERRFATWQVLQAAADPGRQAAFAASDVAYNTWLAADREATRCYRAALEGGA